MAEDERRNKQHAQNLFYLELHHQHGGNFEAMLTPEESSFWDYLPPEHQALLKWSRDWEWEVKQGLQSFNNQKQLAMNVTIQDRAIGRWKSHQRLRQECKKIMRFDDLSVLLFPLLFLRYEYFEERNSYAKQEIVRVMRKQADTVEEKRRVESTEYEDYGINDEWLDLRWMEKQDSDHLKQCSAVWDRYLKEAEPPKLDRDRSAQDRYLKYEIEWQGLDKLNVPIEDFRKGFLDKYKDMSEPRFDAAWKRICKERGANGERVYRAVGDRKNR